MSSDGAPPARCVARWRRRQPRSPAICTAPMFFVLLLVQGLFGNGNSAISYPYMAEMWPGPLRASGFGLVYGISNLGKFIGPAGLAVIIGAANYVSPKAT